jgi:hypothetical protein
MRHLAAGQLRCEKISMSDPLFCNFGLRTLAIRFPDFSMRFESRIVALETISIRAYGLIAAT